MAWRLAHSLVTLRAEVNQWAPDRRKASDGTLGDPAHASRASRHNPNRYGVVTALDITHDPANGCDVHALARRLVKAPHPELAYIISNRQVAKRRTGFRWERYTGSNPHLLHAHFAVGVGSDSDPLPPYDSTQRWGVAAPTPPEEDTMTPEQERKLDEALGLLRALVPNTPRKVVTTGSSVGTVSDAGKPAAELWRWGLESLFRTRALDPSSLAQQIAERLPAASGPVKVADLEAAFRNVLGSLDE